MKKRSNSISDKLSLQSFFLHLSQGVKYLITNEHWRTLKENLQHLYTEEGYVMPDPFNRVMHKCNCMSFSWAVFISTALTSKEYHRGKREVNQAGLKDTINLNMFCSLPPTENFIHFCLFYWIVFSQPFCFVLYDQHLTLALLQLIKLLYVFTLMPCNQN